MADRDNYNIDSDKSTDILAKKAILSHKSTDILAKKAILSQIKIVLMLRQLIGFDNIKEFSTKIDIDNDLIGDVELENIVLVSKNVLKFVNKYSLEITLRKDLISRIYKITCKKK